MDGDPEAEATAFAARFPVSVKTGDERLLEEEVERTWIWDGRIPAAMPFLLTGPPGAGKSLLAQMVTMAAATGTALFGESMIHVPSLYITCEDDDEELTRRAKSVSRGMKLNDLSLFHSDSWLGDPNCLLIRRSEGGFQRTKRWEQLRDFILDNQIKLAILDVAPDFWDGNEIVRVEVNAYVKNCIGGLCNDTGAAIGLLAHPSVQGISSGTGTSGSTAWEGSVRSRLYLTGQDGNGVRRLSVKKSNYGEVGQYTDLAWESGCFQETFCEYQDPNSKDGARQSLGKNAKAVIERIPKGGIGDQALGLAMAEYKKGNKSFRLSFGLEPLLNRGLVCQVQGNYHLTQQGEEYLSKSR